MVNIATTAALLHPAYDAITKNTPGPIAAKIERKQQNNSFLFNYKAHAETIIFFSLKLMWMRPKKLKSFDL